MASRQRIRDVSKSLKLSLFFIWTLWIWAVWLSADGFPQAWDLVTIIPFHLRPPWPHVGAAIGSAIRALCGVALVVSAGCVVGRTALRFVGLRRPAASPPGQHSLLACAAGLPLLALLTQALGLVGLVFSSVLAVLVTVMGAGPILAFMAGWLHSRHARKSPAPSGWLQGPHGLRLVCGAAVLVVGVGALAPEVAWDAVVYHLRVPSLYLLQHKIYPIPEIAHSFFPFSGQMLLMLAKNLGGDPAAKLLHAAVWVACGIGVAQLARVIWGSSAALWALALHLTLPVGLVLANRAYIEFFLVLSCIGALILLTRPFRLTPAVLITAGWLAGAAFGTKYQGAYVAILFGGLILYRSWPRPVPVALYALAGLAAATTWLLRNALWTGNPVFPAFFSGLHWTSLDVTKIAAEAQTFQAHVQTLLVAPRHLLGEFSPDGGLSPMLLTAAAIPLLWRQARRTQVWGLAVILLLVWWLTSPLLRFFIVGATLSCVAAAGVVNGYDLGRAGSRWLRYLTVTGLWCSLAIGFNTLYRGTEPYGAAVGKWSHAEYRSRRLAPAGYVETIDFLEQSVPARRRAYIMGHVFSYELPRRVWFDFLYLRPPLYWWLRGEEQVDRILVRAKQAGLTHVAYNPGGARVIFGAQSELMDWTPGKLKAYLEFWRTHMKPVGRVNTWRIYEIVPEPARFPLPANTLPGTEGLTAPIDLALEAGRPGVAKQLAREALRRFPFFPYLQDRLTRAEESARPR